MNGGSALDMSMSDAFAAPSQGRREKLVSIDGTGHRRGCTVPAVHEPVTES